MIQPVECAAVIVETVEQPTGNKNFFGLIVAKLTLLLNFFSGFQPQQQKLKPTAVPSIFQWTKSPTNTQRKREQRMKDRYSKRKKLEFDVQQVLENDMIQPVECAEFNVDTVEPEFVAEPYIPLAPEFHDMVTQTVPQPLYSIENFNNDDKAIHFYTGLESYSKFMFVLSTLGPAAYFLNYIYHSVENLSVPNQLFMTLIKLRRYTTNFELSRMFNISENSV